MRNFKLLAQILFSNSYNKATFNFFIRGILSSLVVNHVKMCYRRKDGCGQCNMLPQLLQSWKYKMFNLNNLCTLVVNTAYEGSAKSFVTGFGLLQCYVLSNIILLQTFKVFPLY